MLIFILMAVSVPLAIYLARRAYDPYMHLSVKTVTATYVTIAVVVSAFAGVLLSMLVYEVTVDEVPRRFHIESLGDSAGVEGRMFLGSGSIDTEAVFFYYAPRKNGGYGLFHVDASNTAIYEDQIDSGYLIKYCEDQESYAKWIEFPLFDIPGESERYSCAYANRFEFHIPDNSIDRSFNLDAS